jgi:hypothetical protein
MEVKFFEMLAVLLTSTAHHPWQEEAGLKYLLA